MRKPIPFGKYFLLERINVGGMAEVFLGRSVEEPNKLVAIKRILPTMLEDEGFVTMFLDEARISIQLNHPNIVQVYHLGKNEESYYLAMEYVSGSDLRQLCERYRKNCRTMPISQAVFLAMKICEGLDYAHKKMDGHGNSLHIVHRDVSPQNVLVSYHGEVKIIDFGIAKAANRILKTQAGVLKGKFGYMTPEQVRGLPVDHRSDIFATGIILYELLAGERLFKGASDFSILEKIRSAEIEPPRSINCNIPAGLEKVVLKALSKEPEERYLSGADMARELSPFLSVDSPNGEAFDAASLGEAVREVLADVYLAEESRLLRLQEIPEPDSQIIRPKDFIQDLEGEYPIVDHSLALQISKTLAPSSIATEGRSQEDDGEDLPTEIIRFESLLEELEQEDSEATDDSALGVQDDVHDLFADMLPPSECSQQGMSSSVAANQEITVADLLALVSHDVPETKEHDVCTVKTSDLEQTTVLLGKKAFECVEKTPSPSHQLSSAASRTGADRQEQNCQMASRSFRAGALPLILAAVGVVPLVAVLVVAFFRYPSTQRALETQSSSPQAVKRTFSSVFKDSARFSKEAEIKKKLISENNRITKTSEDSSITSVSNSNTDSQADIGQVKISPPPNTENSLVLGSSTKPVQKLKSKNDRIERQKIKVDSKLSSPVMTGKFITSSYPVARIIVDGKETNLWTPVLGNALELKAGKHTITYVTVDGRKTTRKILITANKVTKVTGVEDFE